MNIPEIRKNFEKKLTSIKNLEDLERLRIRYLGRNGIVHELLDNLKKLSPKKRKIEGVAINNLKSTIEKGLSDKQSELDRKQEKTQSIDVTLPGKKYPKGSFHPT